MMDCDEEGFVKFEVNEHDVEFEADPFNSFRKQTKDQAIYGITPPSSFPYELKT